MWNKPHHVPAAAANAGDIITRAVWIRSFSDLSRHIAITKDDPFVSSQLGEGRVVTNKVSFGVRDRHAKDAARFQLVGKRRVPVFHPDVHMITNEMSILISNQRARQQS